MNGGKDIPAAPRYIHSHRTPVNGCPMPLVDRGNSGNIGALDLVRIVEHEVATKKKTAVLIDTVRLGGRRVIRYSPALDSVSLPNDLAVQRGRASAVRCKRRLAGSTYG